MSLFLVLLAFKIPSQYFYVGDAQRSEVYKAQIICKKEGGLDDEEAHQLYFSRCLKVSYTGKKLFKPFCLLEHSIMLSLILAFSY